MAYFNLSFCFLLQNQHLQDQIQQQQQNHQNNTNQQIPIQTHVKMPRGKGADAKPRGRMTAYAFFVQTCREEHKKKHPEETVIFAEFSRKCAERWKVRTFTHFSQVFFLFLFHFLLFKCIVIRLWNLTRLWYRKQTAGDRYDFVCISCTWTITAVNKLYLCASPVYYAIL